MIKINKRAELLVTIIITIITPAIKGNYLFQKLQVFQGIQEALSDIFKGSFKSPLSIVCSRSLKDPRVLRNN